MDEGQHTLKQLKKAQNEITSLGKQDERAKTKIHDHLNIFEPTLFEAKYMLKRTLLLHRQLKNVCRQNLTLKKVLRVAKQQLQEALQENQKEKRGNLDLLAEAAKV